MGEMYPPYIQIILSYFIYQCILITSYTHFCHFRMVMYCILATQDIRNMLEVIKMFSCLLYLCMYFKLCQWVPVTTVWHVLRLRIEERPPIRRVAANKLNKQSRTVDEGWSSSLGVGRGANNPSLLKLMFRNTHRRDDSSGDKTIRR